MATSDLAQSLTREHREIDTGIEAFLASLESGPESGSVNAGPLQDAFTQLRRHIYLEEELLFPPLRTAGLMMPIMVMVKEHGEIWQLMDTIEAALAAAEPSTTSAACRQLLEVLDAHNTKEEPIIYPHGDTDLSDDEAATLADFIATEELPPGWVCAAAR